MRSTLCAIFAAAMLAACHDDDRPNFCNKRGPNGEAPAGCTEKRDFFGV
jgi:hypothetical protein